MYTCNHADCNACGIDRGCERVLDMSLQENTQCLSWCNEGTCDSPDCKDCQSDVGCFGRDPPAPPSPPAPPNLPYWIPLPDGTLRHANEYWAEGATIYTNSWGEFGQPAKVVIKGVAWFGFESGACHIGGSDTRSLESIAKWIKDHGFNAIRLPFAVNGVLEQHPKCLGGGNPSGIASQNPGHFRGRTYTEMLEAVIKVAGDAGLLVMLDAHVSHAGQSGVDDGNARGEDRTSLERAWGQLAGDLCDPIRFWNIIGAGACSMPEECA